ncbi:hypothetical protein FH144_01400 [Staphylococcus caledonicus]|uniref:hypothetical protein n=1 Tax=Staphylococcus sp. acrmy TaxID=2929076 RepID=UPI001F5717C5|nr:hypothetical protein [Staphylococcus sp. acrmy]MCI2947084.1 hypothetical protein [Staphylococcus sp. acrmy]
MISKEAEDYLFKLKTELLFRGKDEKEIHAIGDELEDHFETAEQNGEDVSDILNTPVKQYADKFSKHMSFTEGLPKYVTYFVIYLFALFTIPDFFRKGFTLTLSYLLNVVIIFAISIGVLFLYKKLIINYGEQKRTYIYAFIGGGSIFLLMVLSTFITKHHPIYTILTLTQTQSIIVGTILLIGVMVACFIVKQKVYALIIFVLCLPNIIAQLFTAHNHSQIQYTYISLGILMALLLFQIIYTIYKGNKLRKEDSKKR